MSVRGVTGLAAVAMIAAGLSACHDGAGKHSETTQIRIIGTPRAGRIAPTPRHEPTSADTGPAPRTGVGPQHSASQE